MPTKIRRGRTITLIHPILAWRLKSKSVGKQGYGRDGQQLHMPKRISGGIIEKCRPNQSQYMSSSAMRRASLSLQIQIVFLFRFPPRYSIFLSWRTFSPKPFPKKNKSDIAILRQELTSDENTIMQVLCDVASNGASDSKLMSGTTWIHQNAQACKSLVGQRGVWREFDLWSSKRYNVIQKTRKYRRFTLGLLAYWRCEEYNTGKYGRRDSG